MYLDVLLLTNFLMAYFLLLAAGANASVQTQDGKTAADFAKGNGKCFADAVRKLLK